MRTGDMRKAPAFLLKPLMKFAAVPVRSPSCEVLRNVRFHRPFLRDPFAGRRFATTRRMCPPAEGEVNSIDFAALSTGLKPKQNLPAPRFLGAGGERVGRREVCAAENEFLGTASGGQRTFGPLDSLLRSRGVMLVRIQQRALIQNESPPDAMALIYGQACRADDLLCRRMRIP